MNAHTIPIVTLSNGLRVANFSSPHPFLFEDGITLGACTPEWAREMMLEAIEHTSITTIVTPSEGTVNITNINLTFRLTDKVREALATIDVNSRVDIILVPLPVLTALVDDDDIDLFYLNTKVRVIRVKDRVTKEIYIDRFCI